MDRLARLLSILGKVKDAEGLPEGVLRVPASLVHPVTTGGHYGCALAACLASLKCNNDAWSRVVRKAYQE